MSQSTQATKTEYHSLGGLHSRNLFFTVLEAGSLRSRFQLVSFLERPLLSLQLAKSCLPVKFSDGLFSVQKLKGGEKRGREWGGFIKENKETRELDMFILSTAVMVSQVYVPFKAYQIA